MSVKKSLMFSFVGETWNPLGGACLHNCSYCWAKMLIKKNKMSKYEGEPRLVLKEMHREFKCPSDKMVFVCDMCDLFGDWVSADIINAVLDKIRSCSDTKFLLLTKNPVRYHDFVLPSNCVAGATVESDYLGCGDAPPNVDRLRAMWELKYDSKVERMISVEPVMAFSEQFFRYLVLVEPSFVAVGRDNYSNGLHQPSRDDIEGLISNLEKVGIKVYRKTI